MKFYALHHPGGGRDDVCADCLSSALWEDPTVDLTSLTNPPADTYCQWCGLQAQRVAVGMEPGEVGAA